MDTRLTPPRKENRVEETIEQQIAEIGRMTVGQLKLKYIEVFGEETRSNNRQFLFRRIAWRIQALAEGGLSERARRRALELANDADIRVRAPNKKALDPEVFLKVTARLPKPHDSRLPPPGAWLERNYRGQRIAIKVRVDGFEFEGRLYKTLTAAVNQATGGRWNGFAFFWLPAPGEVNHAQE
jgi:hypothetical protein